MLGQTVALTDGAKMQSATDMVKERTASYAKTISANTKSVANKAVSSAQQSRRSNGATHTRVVIHTTPPAFVSGPVSKQPAPIVTE